MLTTYEDFKRMFLEHYSPFNNVNGARDKLHELKQHATIQDYITAFDNIIVSLLKLLEVD